MLSLLVRFGGRCNQEDKRGCSGCLAMEQDPSPGDCSEKIQPSVRTDPENLRRRDPKRFRDLLTPLLDLDDDVANLQNLDKMLADRFAQFTERRKQLHAMKNENEREIVIKMLEEKEASRATDCSPHTKGDITGVCTPHK